MTAPAGKTPVLHRILRHGIRLGIVLLALFSLTPWAPVSNRLTDLPSHFVPQYAIGAAVLFFFALWLRLGKLWLLSLALVFALNMATLAPYLRPVAAPAAEGLSRLKVLQVNTLYLNRNTAALESLIRLEKPDVIAASETNAAFAALFKKLRDDYPHQHLAPQDGTARGHAVLSRHPLAEPEIVTFADPRIPALRFGILHAGQRIRFLSLHPFTPIANIAARDGDLAAVAAAHDPRHDPQVLLGDFNATPWCPAMKRLVRDTGLRHARTGQGLLPSWPAFFPASFLRIPIDHVLVSPGMTVLDYRLGPAIGSDHLPTIALLGLPKAGQSIEK